MAAKVVKLCVGGQMFMTTEATLLGRGENFFSGLLSGRFPTTAVDGAIFIDRSGRLFEPLLEFLRTGVVTIPPGAAGRQLRAEAEFYLIALPGSPSSLPGSPFPLPTCTISPVSFLHGSGEGDYGDDGIDGDGGTIGGGGAVFRPSQHRPEHFRLPFSSAPSSSSRYPCLLPLSSLRFTSNPRHTAHSRSTDTDDSDALDLRRAMVAVGECALGDVILVYRRQPVSALGSHAASAGPTSVSLRVGAEIVDVGAYTDTLFARVVGVLGQDGWVLRAANAPLTMIGGGHVPFAWLQKKL